MDEVPLSMAIKNVELMHKCSPLHFCLGTARMKLDKATDKEDKQTREEVEQAQNKKVPKAQLILGPSSLRVTTPGSNG